MPGARFPLCGDEYMSLGARAGLGCMLTARVVPFRPSPAEDPRTVEAPAARSSPPRETLRRLTHGWVVASLQVLRGRLREQATQNRRASRAALRLRWTVL